MKRPQFTLRDLLWFTVVVGLAVGWIIEARRPKFSADNEVKIRFFNGLADDLKPLGVKMEVVKSYNEINRATQYSLKLKSATGGLHPSKFEYSQQLNEPVFGPER